MIGLNPGYLLISFLLYITMCPHEFSGPPTALHTEGGAFAGCKTNLKPRNIFLHSFKRIWQAESKNSKWLGVISTNYTKKSRVWLRIYSSVYNTKTRMPCRPGGKYWDSWDFSQPNFAEKVFLLIPFLGGKFAKMCFVIVLPRSYDIDCFEVTGPNQV